MSDQPRCPVCGRKGTPTGPDLFRCEFGHFFDSSPNEGGSYSNDPTKRIEREDELAKARRQNLEGRPRAASNFRFAGRR